MAITTTFATAGTITFDDLLTGTGTDEVPNGYAGLQWDNFWLGTARYLDSGVVSGPNAVSTGFHEPGTFSSATVFSLNSLYITQQNQYGGATYIQGYSGSTLLYSVLAFSDNNTPKFMPLNWSNLTSVVISNPPGGGYFIVDDITINSAPVPEPETYAMLLAGLGMVGYAARRNRIAA